VPPPVLARGSFPELWSRPEIAAGEFHRSYVSTYLERDLRSLQQVGNLQQFERFLRASALRSGQLLNRAELARNVGIAPSTAGLWLSVLERSGLVFLLEPWFGNAGKRLIRSPKLYWRDTGLLCWLIGIGSEAELARSPLVGAVWETFVVGEVQRQLELAAAAGKLHFWRDRSKEVDLVLERGGRFWLGDAKWTELPSSRDGRRLRQVADELPPGVVASTALICRTPHRFPLGDGLEALPLAELGPHWNLG
jgi:predicted AAA+ superfamily ATPase